MDWGLVEKAADALRGLEGQLLAALANSIPIVVCLVLDGGRDRKISGEIVGACPLEIIQVIRPEREGAIISPTPANDQGFDEVLAILAGEEEG